MERPDLEVEVLRAEVHGSHLEADWGEGAEKVHVKKFDDWFESFWYTDSDLDDFTSHLEDLPVAESLQVTQAAGSGLSEEIYNISYFEFMDDFGLEGISYFELALNSVDIYWATESPPANYESDLSYIIYVSGPPEETEPLGLLYRLAAPDSISDEERENRATSITDYIETLTQVSETTNQTYRRDRRREREEHLDHSSR